VNRSAEIFLSHSRVDRAYVELLARHLTAAGLSVWFDQEIDAGDRFDAIIERRIEACTAFVVILSPAAVASDWVGREISYATYRKKPIRPLILKTCDIPILLINLQHEDVRGGRMPSDGFVDALRGQPAPRSDDAVRRTQKPTRRTGPRRALVVWAMPVLVLVLLAEIFAYGWIRLSANGVNPPPSSHSPSPTARTPSPTPTSTSAAQAITNLRIRDKGTSVDLSWNDGSDGKASFLVAVKLKSDLQHSVNALPFPVGTTTATIDGLNPSYDYCFTVAAVFSYNDVRSAPLVCTSRSS
jgi:hypothetical protein